MHIKHVLSLQSCIVYLSFMLPPFLKPVLLDFSLTVKAAPHECVIRTGQP